MVSLDQELISLQEVSQRKLSEKDMVDFLQKKKQEFGEKIQVLFDLINLIPADGYKELDLSLFQEYKTDEKIWRGFTKEMLAISSIVTITNIFDDIFEQSPDVFKSKNLDDFYSLSLDLGNNNIVSLISLLNTIDTFIHEEIDNEINFLQSIIEILRTQIEYGKISTSCSIDDAINYRSKTLGHYFKLLSAIANNPKAIHRFSLLQFDDDLNDIEEDDEVQIQPFLSLAHKYSLHISAASEFLLFLPAMKALNDMLSTGNISQEVATRMSTYYFKQVPSENDLLELIRDFITICKFYENGLIVETPNRSTL